MAPEQLLPPQAPGRPHAVPDLDPESDLGPPSPLTDIYSLGVALFALAAGDLPPQGAPAPAKTKMTQQGADAPWLDASSAQTSSFEQQRQR